MITKVLFVFFITFPSFCLAQHTLNFTHADGVLTPNDYYSASDGITDITNGYWFSNHLSYNNNSNPIIITFLGVQTTVKLTLAFYGTSSTIVAYDGANGSGNVIDMDNTTWGASGSAGTQVTLTNGSASIKSITLTQPPSGLYSEYNSLVYDDVLPVELTSFTANIVQNAVNLKWNTATEVNNYGFNVERLQNPKIAGLQNWEKIGFVEGNGNSNSPKEYSYTDNSISSSGSYSYRLKQIDNDGSFEYSGVVEVSFDKPSEFSLKQNYPNPFNPSTTISYSLPEKTQVMLTVFDILGKEVTTLVNNEQESGTYNVKFDASNLNSGMYIYELKAGNYSRVKKLLLLK